MHYSDEERSFSEARMRRVIQRAAELQRDTEPTVSAHRLTEIAAEVGIDADLLAKAIAEIDAEDRQRLAASHVPQGASTFMARVGPLAAGAAGLVIGGASGVLRQVTNGFGGVHVDTLLGTTLTGIAALLIALAARRTHSQLGYQVRSAALWTGFTAGFALAFPMLADDMLGVGLGLSLVSGLIGALIVSLPRTRGGWFRKARLAHERELERLRERKREQGATHPTELRMGSAMIPTA